MKKLLIIIIVLAILTGGVYWYVTRNTTTTGTSTPVSTFKSFLSFSDSQNQTDTTLPGNTGDVSVNPSIDTVYSESASTLTQITNFAVSGVVAFMDTRPSDSAKEPTGTTAQPLDIVPAIRYVAKSNGHIYERYLDTKATSEISTSTIPNIHEAVFDKYGQSIIYRYITDSSTKIQSFVGTLGKDVGRFLPEGITGVSPSANGSQFFYLAPLGNDVSGFVGNFGDTKKTQVFTSAFTEWLPQWILGDVIFLTTKPSWNVNGSVYALNKSTTAFTKIFGGIKGLTTLASHHGNRILYSGTSPQGPLLGTYNTTDHSFKKISLYTLPEKCVWASDDITVYCGIPNSIIGQEYPDKWYQGLASFSDSILSINTTTGSTRVLIDTEYSASIDATFLTLSPDEKILFMINKKDSTLWSLNLE